MQAVPVCVTVSARQFSAALADRVAACSARPDSTKGAYSYPPFASLAGPVSRLAVGRKRYVAQALQAYAAWPTSGVRGAVRGVAQLHR